MKTRTIAGPAGAALLALCTGTTMSNAQTADGLEARIAALEAKQKAVETAGTVSTATGVNLTFYGYAKADAIYDTDYDLGLTTIGIAGVDGSTLNESSNRIHAYQSRLGIRGLMPTDMGDFKFNIEGDFLGGGGGSFRLRHAYGELGGFLAGQTWSGFGAGAYVLDSWDFNGNAGYASFRVAQFRYTTKLSESLTGTISLEEDAVSWGARPNVVGTLTQAFDQGSLKFAALSRSVESRTGGDVSGWGASISASVKAWDGGLLQLSMMKGEAISSLIQFSGGQQQGFGNSTIYDIDTAGNPIGVEGISVAATQTFAEKFDIYAAYGLQKYDGYSVYDGRLTDSLETIHMGMRYRPVKNVTVGAEYIMTERKEFSGTDFDNNRLQLSARFSF